MPTYDYGCDDCGHEFEQFQSITAAPLETCPQCGGKVQRRINGGAGLIFKGSGFYLTDYKKAGSDAGKTGGDSAKKADGDTAKNEGSDKKATPEKSEKAGKPEKAETKEKTTTE
jgi:putative FmdB family regulatory protein